MPEGNVDSRHTVDARRNDDTNSQNTVDCN